MSGDGERPTVERRNDPPSALSDEQVERSIARLLRVGVIVAAGTVLVGGLLTVMADGGEPRPDLGRFDATASALLPVGDLLPGLLRFEAVAWIQAGLVVMVATPVLRVAVSAYAFLRQRDWTYVAITLAVLAVLAIGLLGGIE